MRHAPSGTATVRKPDGRGKKLAEELRVRFADWYYVISGADFKNLRPSRQDLLKG